VPDRPPELFEPGAAAWDAIVDLKVWGPGDLLILREVCRMVDRLDNLDRLLRADERTWARIEFNVEKREIELVLDEALGESRQYASVLRQLLAQLDLPAAQEKAGAGDGLDEILRARQAREAARRSAAAAELGAAIRPH
jgi:hypothetical protein